MASAFTFDKSTPLLLLNSLFETQRTWTFHHRKPPPEIGSEGLLRDLHVIGDIYILTGWLKPEGAHSLSVHCPYVHLSIFRCRRSRTSLCSPRGKMDPSQSQTQEYPTVGARSSVLPESKKPRFVRLHCPLPPPERSSRRCYRLPVSLRNLSECTRKALHRTALQSGS